ncbi:DUF2577 family protein [Bacillus sp. JJ722]|uniref:DUF2577 family protein n=1 Tax=Bacillus sp. JJ722 TaxID=3122973 RepID=UPI002FFDD642
MSVWRKTGKKHLSLEGDAYSQFAQLMKVNGYNKPIDIIFGTVVSPPPNIEITLDSAGSDFILDKDDILVMEHLTRHKRIATISHTENATRQLGDKTAIDYCEGDLLNDDLAAPNTAFKMNNVELQFEDVLKEGDRIIVAWLDEQDYAVILDRLTRYQ